MLDQTNTFVINLPFRGDRATSVEAELTRVGLPFRFWRAIAKAKGAMGLLETMKGLVEHCIAADLKYALVFEDDVKFLEPVETMWKAIEQLPADFDMMYLGTNLCNMRTEKYSDNLIKLNLGYATHAILYSHKGLKKMQGMLGNNMSSPLDIQIVHTIQTDRKCYGVYPMVATQREGHSDIEGKHVKYDDLLEERFQKATIHLT